MSKTIYSNTPLALSVLVETIQDARKLAEQLSVSQTVSIYEDDGGFRVWDRPTSYAGRFVAKFWDRREVNVEEPERWLATLFFESPDRIRTIRIRLRGVLSLQQAERWGYVTASELSVKEGVPMRLQCVHVSNGEMMIAPGSDYWRESIRIISIEGASEPAAIVI